MFNVLFLDQIAEAGVKRLPTDLYQPVSKVQDADIILLRSSNIQDLTISPRLKVVGRAGAGVNNIPIDRLAAAGVPVLNAPGANANAVKELVIAGLLLSQRHVCDAWDYVRQLDASDNIQRKVEAGKKQFSGTELPGKTIGVIGLGAIGRLVANFCLELGLKVLGYDPMLTVEGAWQLSSRVYRSASLARLYADCDFLTFHVPLTADTKHILGKQHLPRLKDGIVVLNFSREGIVDDQAIVSGLENGTIKNYVTDFPTVEILNRKGVIALPHLGASTLEAEVNCAVMAADQIREFLEQGNIQNAVNFPDVHLPRGSDYRLIVANANIPNMVGQVSTMMADAGLNIHDMINNCRNDVACTIVDVDSRISETLLTSIRGIEGVLQARIL